MSEFWKRVLEQKHGEGDKKGLLLGFQSRGEFPKRIRALDVEDLEGKLSL